MLFSQRKLPYLGEILLGDLCHLSIKELSDSDGKAPVCNSGDPGLIPGLRRCPGEGTGSPLQYSCLKNSMYCGAW